MLPPFGPLCNGIGHRPFHEKASPKEPLGTIYVPAHNEPFSKASAPGFQIPPAEDPDCRRELPEFRPLGDLGVIHVATLLRPKSQIFALFLAVRLWKRLVKDVANIYFAVLQGNIN